MIELELLGVRVSLADGEWQAEDPDLARLLGVAVPKEPFCSPSIPDPEGQMAEKAVALLGGRIISRPEPEPVDLGAVY